MSVMSLLRLILSFYMGCMLAFFGHVWLINSAFTRDNYSPGWKQITAVYWCMYIVVPLAFFSARSLVVRLFPKRKPDPC